MLPETVNKSSKALLHAEQLAKRWNRLRISYYIWADIVLYMGSGHSLSICYGIFFHASDIGPGQTEYLKS